MVITTVTCMPAYIPKNTSMALIEMNKELRQTSLHNVNNSIVCVLVVDNNGNQLEV